jgi:Holliday junction resolvase
MPKNPFLDRAEKTRNLSNSHRRSPRQEQAFEKSLSTATRAARRTAASGSRDVKGDLRIKGVARIEAKTTAKQSFSLTREMVGKIEAAAAGAGEMPVIVIEFTDGYGKVLQEVAVMPMYALQTLIDGQV